jgi:hypothetical protein
MFNLFANDPVYNYRVYLNTGATIDVKNCKDLALDISNQTGKIISYNFTFHSADVASLRYIDPTAIVAIAKI